LLQEISLLCYIQIVLRILFEERIAIERGRNVFLGRNIGAYSSGEEKK
jgi:hypothetical protein